MNTPLFTIDVNVRLVQRRFTEHVIDLYENELKWDPIMYQHEVQLVLSPKYKQMNNIWKCDDIRQWMQKLIRVKPEMIFFLENNENGVDLALACVGEILNSKQAEESLIDNIQINPQMKTYLVESLEQLVQVHNIPISSTHDLYMKILSIPNTKTIKVNLCI
ncbi:hypothetical protein [Viridibacillus arvi]|uniref:hypothetical protein n=1 Tax=Viridibacillus arvi TaxID=263475 RepID=UPI003D28014B